MEQQLLTLNEFAAAIGCTLACARRWARERRITTTKIGRLVRVPETEISRLIAAGLRPAVPKTRKGAVLR
jgi:excisionase family DNA binding protein